MAKAKRVGICHLIKEEVDPEVCKNFLSKFGTNLKINKKNMQNVLDDNELSSNIRFLTAVLKNMPEKYKVNDYNFPYMTIDHFRGSLQGYINDKK